MMNVINSEIYKILKSKIFNAVLILFSLMSLVLLYTGIKEKLTGISQEIMGTGFEVYKSSYDADAFLYIILIFTVFLLTSEYTNASIRQMACRGIARWKLVLGQYIAMALILTIVVLGFGFINSGIYTILSSLGEVDISAFIRMNLAIIMMIWSVTAIGTFLSYLLKNAGITIIVSMLLVTGSSLASGLIADLVKNNNLSMYSLTNMRKIIINYASSPEEVIKCSLILLIIGLISMTGAVVLFSKRDVD